MGSISLPNSFLAGELAKAVEVNANFASILSWSQDGAGGTAYAGVQNDNFGIMTGFVRWNMITNDQAIKVTSTSDVGTVSIVQSEALLPAEQGFLLKHSAVETNLTASVFHVVVDSVSSVIPAVKVTYKGTGKALSINDASSEVASIDESGNAVFEGDIDCNGSADIAVALDVGTDLGVGGDLDVNGAGPHSISNNLDVDSCDVAGLLTCDLVNATSPTGQSVFTNDVDIQGTLTLATLLLTNLTVTNDASVGNTLSIGPATSVVISKANNLSLQIENKVKLGITGPTVGPEAVGNTNSTGLSITSSVGTKNEVAVTSENVAGRQHMRIIRGRIALGFGAPAILGGEGFTLSGSGASITIHFSPAFTDTPCVTLGPENSHAFWTIGGSSSSIVLQKAGITGSDNCFFIAIGLST